MGGQPRNLQRDNHYLPACYQESFAGSDGRVWAKFAGKEPEQRKPAKLGRSRSLYIRKIRGVEDDRVEVFFGREVEIRFAELARRIKAEANGLSELTQREQADLLLFIASQAVRTLAHKNCVDTQAGREVTREEFLYAMARQMWTVADVWGKNPPSLRFFTNLPFVSDQFISGDHPVVVIHEHNNQIWVPTAEPVHRITGITNLLNDPSCGFWLALSPYICVNVVPRNGDSLYLPPSTMEPPQVRMLNHLVANQSKIFTLARDRASLN